MLDKDLNHAAHTDGARIVDWRRMGHFFILEKMKYSNYIQKCCKLLNSTMRRIIKATWAEVELERKFAS